MARGGSRKKKDKKKKPSRFKKPKDKAKHRSLSEIKHFDQIRQFQEREVKHEKRERNVTNVVDEESSDEEVQENPLDQLLSTFGGEGAYSSNNMAIDSDDSSDEMEDSNDCESGKGNSDSFEHLNETDNVKDVQVNKEDGRDSLADVEASENIPNNEEEKDEAEEEEEDENAKDDNFDDLLDKEDEAEISNNCDPFLVHLNYELNDAMLNSVTSSPQIVKTSKGYWPILHNLKFEIPKYVKTGFDNKTEQITLDEKKEYAKEYDPPKLITDLDWNKLSVKTQISNNISKANKKQLYAEKNNQSLTDFQKEIFSVINNYQDFYYPEESLNNLEEIRFVYCLHAVNHILKTRLRIVHHNERLSKKSKKQVPDEFRDQGLVRPKVVILAPFRESCLRIVNMISEILLSKTKGNVVNKSRFMDEFSGSELIMPKRNPKPEDYEALFKGNVDDTFRIGLTVTKKTLKLFTDFYSSDIIIASPLGLRMVIGAEGDHERDYDFLASVELLILDQADVFLMQNWDHLLLIFDHLHVQPKENHGTDFSRIRPWAVNGWTKYYRQSLIFSSIVTPEFNALFNRRCQNYAGKVRVVNPVEDGSICRIIIPLAQVFRKFEANSAADAIDARFKVFTETILPQYNDSLTHGVLIYVPSYFDYLRIRNYLKREDHTFVQISEYSKDSKVARARDMFFHNQARLLLYSERFHFFRRIRLKGIRHVIFYQLPTFPHFYSELCNLMQECNQNKFLSNDGTNSVTVLYSKYDVHQLSAIVRTSRAAKMINSEKQVHMFTT